jgi:adenylosuccinate synthase
VEYITLPGWQSSIADVRDYEKLPHNAKKYIEMIEEKVQVPGMYVTASLLVSNPAVTFCPF